MSLNSSSHSALLSNMARWSAGLVFSDIPPEVIELAKRCFIDTLGVAIAGSRTGVAQRARSVMQGMGGRGDAMLLGSHALLSANAAAFVNATAAHALDFDDNAYPGFVHGSAVIVPAALAVAQAENLSGERLLTAFVAGAECEYALAKALTRDLYDQGWWTTGVLGPVGACAAACHALGLDSQRTACALGFAVAGAGGLKACFGSDAKMLLAGRASESGVIAAFLGKHGCSGPLEAIEHEKGLAAMFNQGTLDRSMLEELGQQWSLLTPGVDVKRIAVCLSSHAAVDALRALLAHASIDAGDIHSIVCDVPPIVIENLIYDHPTTRQQAQFSMPFALGCTWLFGDVEQKHLDDDFVLRPDLLDTMKRIRMISSPRWNNPQLTQSAPEGAWVQVTMSDGSAYEEFCAMPLGAASKPLSHAQLRDKFMRCSTQVMHADSALALLDSLLKLEHVSQVRALFSRETAEGATLT